jgi:hypothetical protein
VYYFHTIKNLFDSILNIAWNISILSLSIDVNLAGLLLLIVPFLLLWKIIGKHFILVDVELNINGSKLRYKINRTYRNLEIAHKIYIELITRKAALPLDEENDIIIEIYDSWYSLFRITRDEIKLISGEHLSNNNNSEQLINMAVAILNQGLRPHLTKFQGDFRKWYKQEAGNKDNTDLTPQQIQKKYPKYKELIVSLKKVNIILQDYASQLYKFIHYAPNEVKNA